MTRGAQEADREIGDPRETQEHRLFEAQDKQECLCHKTQEGGLKTAATKARETQEADQEIGDPGETQEHRPFEAQGKQSCRDGRRIVS